MTTPDASTMSALESRVRRLEDLEAIRDITARYGHSVSRGFAGRGIDWALFSSVFTDDAVWNSEFMKIHVTGRDAIVEDMHKQDGTGASVHAFINPVIDLDGDTATGRWVMPIGATQDDSNRSVYLCADLNYRRAEQGWRISEVDLKFATAVVVSH